MLLWTLKSPTLPETKYSFPANLFTSMWTKSKPQMLGSEFPFIYQFRFRRKKQNNNMSNFKIDSKCVFAIQRGILMWDVGGKFHQINGVWLIFFEGKINDFLSKPKK